MEVFFLFLLIFIMIIALGSGFPLAFALPGCAILTIFIAGISGYIFEGNSNEYFVSDGPFQWLNAGITNFRGVYWEVERDTLIAIPLFIFMGIMLEKSKIAEDLLISMGQLFGPVPGGSRNFSNICWSIISSNNWNCWSNSSCYGFNFFTSYDEK